MEKMNYKSAVIHFYLIFFFLVLKSHCKQRICIVYVKNIVILLFRFGHKSRAYCNKMLLNYYNRKNTKTKKVNRVFK